MLKKIFSYGFIEGIAKGLNKLTILLLPLLLSTTDYGKVGLLVSIEMVIPLISLLGFERAVLRFYGEKSKYTGFKKTIFSSALWTHLFLIIIISILYGAGYKTFFGLHLFPDLILVVVLIYFQGTNLITLNMLRVEENHKKYFKGRLFIQGCKFTLVLLCVFISQHYLGYVVGAIIAAITANILFRTQRTDNEQPTFSKKTFLSLFAFSWPFMFHGVAGNLLGNADKFILERYMSLNEVGLYTLAYSFGSTMIFAFVGISVFLEPMIYKEKRDAQRKQILNKFLLISIGFGLLAYILITLASNYVLPYFYDESYTLVFKYIPLIAIAFLIYPYYLKSNYTMIYDKRSLPIAVMSIVSASINIGLNVYFIPIYGIYAAVFTTLISYIIQAFLFVFMANKYKFNGELLEVFIFGGILSLCVYYKLNFYFIAIIIIFFLTYIYFYKLKSKKIEC
ncbi:oligosaccharide flippase family protein [uncultured Marixanthomonas sp.]|uniref:lipopolysaccharide biosynthesis protein n=1 Tax=uncultured Marixanthomonas sp. TaxID=757245 RepID=UPI0030DB6C14